VQCRAYHALLSFTPVSVWPSDRFVTDGHIEPIKYPIKFDGILLGSRWYWVDSPAIRSEGSSESRGDLFVALLWDQTSGGIEHWHMLEFKLRHARLSSAGLTMAQFSTLSLHCFRWEKKHWMGRYVYLECTCKNLEWSVQNCGRNRWEGQTETGVNDSTVQLPCRIYRAWPLSIL